MKCILIIVSIIYFSLNIYSSEKKMNIIKASDIIKEINEGKNVFYQNTIIKGDLDFTDVKNVVRKSEKDYVCYIESAITLINCTIKGKVISASDKNKQEYTTVFMKSISIIDSKLENDVVMYGCRYNGDIDFSGSTFNNYTVFWSTTFCGRVNCVNTIFKSTLSFHEAYFMNFTYFGSQMLGDTLFGKVRFIGTISFRRGVFGDKISFCGSIFKDAADFRESEFKQYADFSSTDFYSKAYFESAKFNCSADFSGSTECGKPFDPSKSE